MPTITDPQYPYYDTQTVFNVDIDDLYNRFITPIENLRSHFNALVPGSQELSTPQYQESRCHAFYRMIGFPVVASDGSGFYSPGYDPTLNTDATTSSSYQQIAAKATGLATPTYLRETQEQVVYNAVWQAGGINASAVCIGSMFLRSFDKQFSDDDSIGPLDYDPTQIQTVSARTSAISQMFNNPTTATYTSQFSNINQSLLRSVHIIKPFTVSSSIDAGVIPKANRVAAPFLIDKSQLQIFDPQTGPTVFVKRPYIENVISIRFAASNANISTQQLVASITNQIKSDGVTTDQDLITAISNTNNLNVVSLNAFSNYLNVIRALVRVLDTSTKELGQIRNTINWQPNPNVNIGPEAGQTGASINDATPGDPNNNYTNKKIELQIIQIMQQQILAQVMNAGLNNTVDPGNFAFSNIDDIVFGGMGQSAKTSYDDQLTQLNDYRNKLGNDGLYLLKTIEVIMGEFSGLGLLDILAIQAALWIVSPAALVSLIDQRAYTRLLLRKDINAPPGGIGIIPALTQYETIVKQMYKLIGSYIDIYTTQGQFTDIQNQ